MSEGTQLRLDLTEWYPLGDKVDCHDNGTSTSDLIGHHIATCCHNQIPNHQTHEAMESKQETPR